MDFDPIRAHEMIEQRVTARTGRPRLGTNVADAVMAVAVLGFVALMANALVRFGVQPIVSFVQDVIAHGADREDVATLFSAVGSVVSLVLIMTFLSSLYWSHRTRRLVRESDREYEMKFAEMRKMVAENVALFREIEARTGEDFFDDTGQI